MMSENNETETQAQQPNETGVAGEVDASKAQLQEAQNKYLYLYAEFENYKKRVIKERSDLVKFGHEGLTRDLLQVTDNLDRALEHTNNLEALVSGIRMVNQQLKETLSRYGVTAVNALGEKFDPSMHEAVAQEKVGGESNGHEEGTVIKEHQKGYTLHGRLLRPARVVVATK
jgi:molecular chaperone GrpE